MQKKHPSNLKVALLTAQSPAGVIGGAERFYSGLHRGLSDIGLDVAELSVPAEEPSFEAILHNYNFCAALDLGSFDIVVSTKTPTYIVSHPCHIMYLVHTVRVFDDMFDHNFPSPSRETCEQRAQLHRLDLEAMSRLSGRFAIGHEVAKRLYRWRGIDAEVLHPPLCMADFKPGEHEDFFFLPGRLHPWKRVDLVIEAVKRSQLPMRLVVAGIGEDEARLRNMADGDSRIQFTGKIDDRNLLELYSRCLAVPFVPLHEDYGYITLEAFASHKPVITCTDSGEPAHFVKHRENGLVTSPDPESMRASLEWTFQHRQEAFEMGKRGAASIAGMSWRKVAFRLVDAALRGAREKTAAHVVFTRKKRVAVLDMQPIAPPVGGGRLRLLGLYHNLGENFQTSYLGTFDWRGEAYRRHFLSETLEETDIPLSDEHHDAADALKARAGGKTVINLSFGMLGRLSPDYVREALHAIRKSDIVVFSHPWVYPLVEKTIASTQFVVYDAHNVEGYLQAQLLDERNPSEAEILRHVVETEYALGSRANLVLTCSQEDSIRFNRFYRFPFEKMRVVPNGVMAFSELILEKKDRASLRAELGVPRDAFAAIFIGSAYAPNKEAADFIIQRIAPLLPDTFFIIAGGVGSEVSADAMNVIITGQIDEIGKRDWLRASNIALNPMFSGSGTNIKMFDFMAFGLPVVTTSAGARGIDTGDRFPFFIVQPEAEAFAHAIRKLRERELHAFMSQEARFCVEDEYAWEKISPQAGCILSSRHSLSGQPRPMISLIVTAAENHDRLENLMKLLRNQTERDFEVIVVDQSGASTARPAHLPGVPLEYLYSSSRSAVHSRNKGAAAAQGHWLFFADDSFTPEEGFFLDLRSILLHPANVIVQGERAQTGQGIRWTPLTKESLEETISLEPFSFIKNDLFQQRGGFDPWYETTDLLLERERLPFLLKREARLDEQPAATKGTGNIGWISTWNTKCGIASYSQNLVRAFPEKVTILANYSEETITNDQENVKRCWTLGSTDFHALEREIDANGLNTLVIQFQYGLFDFEKLASFMDMQKQQGRRIVVMMHCTCDLGTDPNKRLCILAPSLKKCDMLLVHTVDDVLRLKENSLMHNVKLFPQGIIDYIPKNIKNSEGTRFRLASYGFFREHKGLLELIHAVNILRSRGIDIHLHMVNAEYPAPDSRVTIEKARELLLELHLEENVEMTTDYLSDEESIELLAASDLVVYPYQNTNESSSAAVRHGIASGRPVAVTPLEIFNDVASAVLGLPGTSPEEIADGIEHIAYQLRTNAPGMMRTLRRTEEWLKSRRFSLLGKKLLGILLR